MNPMSGITYDMRKLKKWDSHETTINNYCSLIYMAGGDSLSAQTLTYLHYQPSIHVMTPPPASRQFERLYWGDTYI